MKRFIILTVAVVIVALGLGFNGGLLVAKGIFYGKAIKEIPAGTLHAYIVQEAFDRETGEPVYWFIGQPTIWQNIYGKNLPVRTGEIRFYQIPRQKLTNPPTASFDVEIQIK